MSKSLDRSACCVRIASVGMLVATVILLGMAVVSGLHAGLRTGDSFHDWLVNATTPLALTVGSLVVAVWTFFLYLHMQVLLKNKAANESMSARMERLESLLEDVSRSSRKQSELLALSDQSKSLLFRDREIEAFREAIHDDLIRQDYRSAAALIDMIEKRLGYVEEAARLRHDVEAGQKATIQERLNHAIARVERTIEQKDWARAHREAQKLGRLFPDNSKVASLPEQIEQGRIAHKRDLLTAYGEAVRKNDVDRGIELLKELDLYLTPQEAAALEESARGVFRAKLHMLGVQFAIKVTEGQWAEAVAVGEEIVREFPNTRMAQEVQQKMDSLKAKATAGN